MTLTHDFAIQTTEVTQAQFEQVLGYNSTYCPGGDKFGVRCVRTLAP